MAGNKNLHRANREKNDEFYTQLVDIENELKHYTRHFKGKIIFCNCDDPTESNFFRYFALNFNRLGIKKLITTHFDYDRPTYRLELERPLDLFDLDREGNLDFEYLKRIPLAENGDFRSHECLEILEQADIVITNPPFSLFREYVAQLMKYQKKFVIIGNQNAITYKEIFPLIKENKIWLGYGRATGGNSMWFMIKDDAPFNKHEKQENGKRIVPVSSKWFTNLDIAKRHEELLLYKSYSPEEYPQYDNYDAIEVSKTKDIPMDYEGIMGVPITFLDKYNPEQFEIVGCSYNYGRPDGWHESINMNVTINQKSIYKRLLIRNKKPQNHN